MWPRPDTNMPTIGTLLPAILMQTAADLRDEDPENAARFAELARRLAIEEQKTDEEETP